MKKRRCYLCGGKLVNGRCTLCGLDNTKIERKNYRLNESSFDGKGLRQSIYVNPITESRPVG